MNDYAYYRNSDHYYSEYIKYRNAWEQEHSKNSSLHSQLEAAVRKIPKNVKLNDPDLQEIRDRIIAEDKVKLEAETASKLQRQRAIALTKKPLYKLTVYELNLIREEGLLCE